MAEFWNPTARSHDVDDVFGTHTYRGAALDAGNVRKMFKRVCTEAGIGEGWTPRELRTAYRFSSPRHWSIRCGGENLSCGFVTSLCADARLLPNTMKRAGVSEET